MTKISILALSLYHHTAEMEGIARFARQAGWAVRFVINSRDPIPLNRNFDGMIIISGYRNEAISHYLKHSKIPKVLVGRNTPDAESQPSVWYNLQDTLEMAADYFLSRSYRHMAIVSHERYQNEINYLRKKVIHAGAELICMDAGSIREELRKAPKPLAIMALDDDWAVELYQTCEDLQLQVPEEIAILGTSNTRHLCEFNTVPLSSIDTQVSRCAFVAAQKLSQILNGQTVESELLPPKRIVVRESTAIDAIADTRVAKALKLLQRRFREPLSIDNIATECALNRYRLDTLFKEETKVTMKAFLQNLRMQEALRLLKNTDLPVNEIARAVSYRNHVSFLRAFHKFQNCSPSEFRKAMKD